MTINKILKIKKIIKICEYTFTEVIFLIKNKNIKEEILPLQIETEFTELIKSCLYYQLFEEGLISHKEYILLQEILNIKKGE